MDIILSVIGFALFGVPMLLVAAWIRLDSPGPALFRQVRVGRGGRFFEILKFRTMSLRNGGIALTVRGDSRVTRVGMFLRASKIDELPQLINVLKGDMSLVGPRPEVPEYAFRYPEQKLVWSVRPGITDPTAIRFRDESALLARMDDPERYYVETVLPQKIEGYLEYLERRSLLYDVAVILNTVRALVLDRLGGEDADDDR